MVKDAYRYFRIEARELLEQLGQGMLELEKGAGPEQSPQTLPRLLRLAHTLKGAARVVKQIEIAEHAHAIEDILVPLRDTGAALMRPQADALLRLHDQIGLRVAALGAPEPAEAAAPAAPVAAPILPSAAALPPSQGPQATDADIDAVLEGVAQVHQQLAALQHSLALAHRAGELAQQLEGRLAPKRAAASPVRAGAHHATAQELAALLATLESKLQGSLHQLNRELDQVRDNADQLRLTPAARLFMPLERAARDAAQGLGKQLVFDGQGADVRLDGEVLNLAQAALLQMVRNAVAHGIESPHERLAAGKPAQGSITVQVLRRGQRVAFECRDDGAGLNLQALRERAQRKGWLAEATQELDAQALLQLLLRGGLSTAATVNEHAGRGVGLDVVRDAAERLGGHVGVQTEPGRGTTLTLTVPLRLAALEALLVRTAGMVVALPLNAVRKTMRVGPHEVAVSVQGCTLVYGNEAIPYAPLARALRPAAWFEQGLSAVVLEVDGHIAALGVDGIAGIANTVLRPLPELMPAEPLLAGVSMDAEGQPQLVMDPAGLVAFARNAGHRTREAQAPRPPVLVVDDSLTTRMLEQSILESAGYTVHAAVSAEDALERARHQRYALFLVDVEMPGMDGFTFVERTRADPLLREVPALLISSRSSPQDKQRGLAAGASGYIVKSEFAQEEFLQKVRQLVGQAEAVS